MAHGRLAEVRRSEEARRSGGGSRPRWAKAASVATRPARRAHQEALLEQVGLVDVLDRVGLLAHRHGQRRQPDRAAAELLADARRISRSSRSSPASSTSSRSSASRATRASIVPAPRTSAKSRTRLSSRLATRGVPRERAGDRLGAGVVDLHLEDAGRAAHDPREVRRLVELEPVGHAEAVAQRRGQQAGARGGADQRELGQVERDHARPAPCPTVIGSLRSSIAG